MAGYIISMVLSLGSVIASYIGIVQQDARLQFGGIALLSADVGLLVFYLSRMQKAAQVPETTEVVVEDLESAMPEAVVEDLESSTPEAVVEDLESATPEAVVKDLESATPEAVVEDLESATPEAVVEDLESATPEAVVEDLESSTPEAPAPILALADRVAEILRRGANAQVHVETMVGDRCVLQIQTTTGKRHVGIVLYTENSIGLADIRGLCSLILSTQSQHVEPSVRGVFFTNGTFSAQVVQWVKGKPLHLIDGYGLHQLAAKYDLE